MNSSFHDQELSRIIRGHHDAYLVDIFGERDCGLSPQRIQELRDQGFLSQKYTSTSTGSPKFHDQNFTSVALSVPKLLTYLGDSLQNDKIQAVLRDPLPTVAAKVAAFVAKHDEQIKDAPEFIFSEPSIKADPADKSMIASEPPNYPPGITTPGDRENYRENINRVGMYCRGLGNEWDDLLQEAIGEHWRGAVLLPEDVPNPDKRQALLDIIRREVLQEWHGERSPSKLAQTLNRLTGEYGRNWKRIVETEFQALANESTAKEALKWYGEDAEVARVPESAACKYCKKLFLKGDGAPKIFKVRELLGNGVNVGRKPAQWLATLWPIHPQCRCLTMVVPPHCTVNVRGYLTVKIKDKEAA